jgi:hypothetical protein
VCFGVKYRWPAGGSHKEAVYQHGWYFLGEAIRLLLILALGVCWEGAVEISGITVD